MITRPTIVGLMDFPQGAVGFERMGIVVPRPGRIRANHGRSPACGITGKVVTHKGGGSSLPGRSPSWARAGPFSLGSGRFFSSEWSFSLLLGCGLGLGLGPRRPVGGRAMAGGAGEVLVDVAHGLGGEGELAGAFVASGLGVAPGRVVEVTGRIVVEPRVLAFVGVIELVADVVVGSSQDVNHSRGRLRGRPGGRRRQVGSGLGRSYCAALRDSSTARARRAPRHQSRGRRVRRARLWALTPSR